MFTLRQFLICLLLNFRKNFVCSQNSADSFFDKEDDGVNQDALKIHLSLKEAQDESRLQRRYGHAASPFFFLCHSPRPGEPTDVGSDDVSVGLDVTGEKKFDSGYEPQVVYELLVSSSVQLDGLLLTGVHAFTKEFSVSNHLHLPPSVSGRNSAGTVCAFLHSHISRKPRLKTSVMWMSPPAGAGCVAFLATGSLHGSILFKDLLIREVCEKGDPARHRRCRQHSSLVPWHMQAPRPHQGCHFRGAYASNTEKPLDQLRKRESFLTSKNEHGFVFKDDFENSGLDNSIWDKVQSGSLQVLPFRKPAGQSLTFEGNTSYVQTLPLDFSKAKHFQFTLGPGKCNNGGKVRISFGSVSPIPKPERRQKPVVQQKTTSTETEKIITTQVSTEKDLQGSGEETTNSATQQNILTHLRIKDKESSEEKTTTMNSETEELTSMNSESKELPTMNSETEELTTMNSESKELPTMNSETEELTTMNSETEELTTMNSESEELTTMNSETEELTTMNSETGEKDRGEESGRHIPRMTSMLGYESINTTTFQSESDPGRGDIDLSAANEVSLDDFFPQGNGFPNPFGGGSSFYEDRMQSDQAPSLHSCSYWEVADVHEIPNLQEVHTRAIPSRFQKKGICIKWETVDPQNELGPSNVKDKDSPLCWSLDNVATVTKESMIGPIEEDFDPVDPSNWLFFPRGQIKETCGSEGHSLAFEGASIDSWASTRQIDLSDKELTQDTIIHKVFTTVDESDGWLLKGANTDVCKDEVTKFTFDKEGKREICSPFLDGRSFGVIRLVGGLSQCSGSENASLVLTVDLNGKRSRVRDVLFKTHDDVIILPLTSASQRTGIKICLEQLEAAEGEDSWTLKELSILPWMPSNPEHFLQVQLNLNCGFEEGKVDIEATSDGGRNWWSLHERCIPGRCNGASSALSPMTATGIDAGWTLVTLPLPYIALTPSTRIRIRQMEPGNSIWRPSWAIDNIYIGKCTQGCNGHGQCVTGGKCKCQYGYVGEACETPERRSPVYISEQFMSNIDTSANILEVSGGETSYQCGIVGSGQAAVFKGRGLRYITTVDVDTTEAHLLQFHFRAGTISDIGKCPGPNEDNEGVYVHYSCSGGATWHLLQTLHPKDNKEPRHINIALPAKARNPSCRFQIWQAEHSGSGRDMWAVDDLTVTSRRFNTIELTFEDVQEANNSLRFHLGKIENSCGRNDTLVFSDSSTNGLVRFMETKSVGVGPSYMMQFDLVIGCGEFAYSDELNSTVVLEYSLNHGLTWKLVQRPCTPSTPGCQSHFTRGTVYHVSEFHKWKRVTLRLPKHTWSHTTRLRLRQLESSDVGLPWSVDNIYIGHQCNGLCSGHGYCTTRGCRCDQEFHGHKCLPLHKLYREIDADFDDTDHIAKYSFQVIGGNLAAQFEACGTVVSGNNLYFGTPGIRHFETDDINAEELFSIMFFLVIGGDHGLQRACQSSREIRPSSEETVSFGSVVLEYSTDGGISWNFLKEMIRSEYRKPKHFHMVLEEKVLKKAKEESGIIRFRLWQPKHNTEDQWAIDNFIVKKAIETKTLQANFKDDAVVMSPWLSSTKYSQRKYCSSENPAQVMDSTDPLRMAVTNRLTLNESDVISFQISVGCKDVANEGFPVRLEFSRDGGVTWDLLREGCLPKSLKCKGPEEPSIYWPGHHGPWQRILLPVDHRLSHGDVQIRWIQENPDETRGGEFALRDLYIGPPCKYSCMGHGTCTAEGKCKCDEGFSGKFCGIRKTANKPWLRDGFDGEGLPANFWENADGAVVSAGCNPDHLGSVMFFSGDGHRFITTKELDTRNVKYLVFDLQIGANNYDSRCQEGISPRDNVVAEFSTDNSLTWNLLQEFEPSHTINRKKPFFIPLPRSARTKQTRFRWWQAPPYMLGTNKKEEQAEWQLDNVMVLANESIPSTLEEDFSSAHDDNWFMIKGGQREKGCAKTGESLVFSGHSPLRYAETWDFETSEATVLQFDIMPGCEKRKVPTEIHVEYSTNNGKDWHLVKNGCYPPNSKCNTHDLPSIYSSKAISQWKRITLKLPQRIETERTRLRFRQEKKNGDVIDPSSSWAIDNIFIGDSCPWMCSGQGYCHQQKCDCDEGFFGEYCVPSHVLPCELLDTFDQDKINSSLWKDVQGAEISNACRTLVSKTALVFIKDGPRYATTIDLDMTGGQFVQFTLFMGCLGNGGHSRKKRSLDISQDKQNGSILVQFSTNGGITWRDLKNIQFHPQDDAAFISIELSDFPQSRANATRFRVWQPNVRGSMVDVWAIDNFFIGGAPVNPNVLYEDFNSNEPIRDAWIDWPGGFLKPMCGSFEARSALVIQAEEGEHSVYTKDLYVDGHSVVQFDLKVGCENVSNDAHNVTLEFSSDFGLTWTPIRVIKPLFDRSPDFLHELQTPTVYYPNAARGWERIIIPLSDVPICGNVRFRWWQGYYHSKEVSEEWALDNIYIGPACRHHCSGHGYCINGDTCDCDEGYDGAEYCYNTIQNDQQILEDFEDFDKSSNFLKWSGAEISSLCDVLSGENLLFWQQGERMLVTKDLDLVHGSVVQFYLRMACSALLYGQQTDEDEPIVLQFSTDGGITWNLISTLSEDVTEMEALPDTRHFTISLPESSKTNSTRLRWWQPSQNGKFFSQWAIDQIYIGSTALGLPFFFDNSTGSEYLLRPGSKMEKTCGLSIPSVHFAKSNGVRFAETPDIVTQRETYMQFEISIGCKETNHCFDVELEYSIDHGKTWQNVREDCFPSDPDCPEFWSASKMTSDLYTSLTQVNFKLPPRARSKLARFRVGQKHPWDSQHSWLLSRFYIGSDCPQMCSGRGFCETGTCICNKGWTGDNCEQRLEDLPKFIADDFKSAASQSIWKRVVGAKVSEICGPIASGEALHFYGGCSRLLESVEIDLREALFVQFNFRSGCLHPIKNESASGDNSVLVQISCNGGINWNTLRRLPLIYHESVYVWIEIPSRWRCLGAQVRWWQPGNGPRSNLYDWALDSVIIGGKEDPPDSISLTSPDDLKFPLWLRGYNAKPGKYCEFNDTVQVLESTPSEPAIVQTTDIQISPKHSIHFRLALGCGALWDNSIEPVSLEFSKDFGRTWRLVRELCLPFNSTSCTDLHDESIFFAPQHWQYYVFPLETIAPLKYVRFRWIQNETADVMGTHKWALRDVYIGLSCPYHCLGRGSCINGTCICDSSYSGKYCNTILVDNVPYIKDTFKSPHFLDHWQHQQGALLAPGCGESIEEPPAATFQGPHTRALMTKPVDTRSGRFVLFTAQIGSSFGTGLCRQPEERLHNVFLQYSTDGGIKWHLLRELDHALYRKPREDYILIPRDAMTPATIFRFWQPRLNPIPPAWALDDVFIGGSEIGAAELTESFSNEPTVSEWLFAPHSNTEDNYCQKGDNGSLVWLADHPGHRAITTQELLIQEGHILQFKISVGCQQIKTECYKGPQVHLKFTKAGGATGWDLVRDSCIPETSPDPDCFPYVFHGPSTFTPDVYSSWTRITIPLPEKTWSSTTQLRWVQDAGRAGGQVERILPWALDDVYVGIPCQMHCRGRGDCVRGKCICDVGYEGETCEPHPSHKGPLPSSLIDGFEGGVNSNWATVTGGHVGLGCNSLAPYGHGKHLYFNGCGIRQAVTFDLDTRKASKVMFVLRIGSHDGMRSCRVDVSDPKRIENKGVIFQFSPDNGISWTTIDVHNPLDFRKARRVAYSLPKEARQNGVQLRWWQPDHDGLGTDQWALDNVEIVMAQRKPTHQYETHVYHMDDL